MSELTVTIKKQTDIDAPPAVVFESILEQISSGFTHPDGKPMPLMLERWPGGRWYRDLGDDTGHWWGQVQVIKPPTLLELWGPMFMSFAAASHVQYRITEQAGGSSLTLTHGMLGDITEDMKKGMNIGWDHIMSSIAKRAKR